MKFEEFLIAPATLPFKIATNRDVLSFFVKISCAVSNKEVFKIIPKAMSDFYSYL